MSLFSLPTFVKIYLISFLRDDEVCGFFLACKKFYALLEKYINNFREIDIRTLHSEGRFIVLCSSKKINIDYFKEACSSSLILTKLLIKKGARDFNNGIYNSCFKNRRDVTELLILKNANLDFAIRGACCGGHKDLVKFLIEKGVVAFSDGLFGACLVVIKIL